MHVFRVFERDPHQPCHICCAPPISIGRSDDLLRPHHGVLLSLVPFASPGRKTVSQRWNEWGIQWHCRRQIRNRLSCPTTTGDDDDAQAAHLEQSTPYFVLSELTAALMAIIVEPDRKGRIVMKEFSEAMPTEVQCGKNESRDLVNLVNTDYYVTYQNAWTHPCLQASMGCLFAPILLFALGYPRPARWAWHAPYFFRRAA